MPVVEIKMWEGRTKEQKEKIIKGLSDVLVNVLGIPEDAITVIIYDVPKYNWGMKGGSAARL